MSNQYNTDNIKQLMDKIDVLTSLVHNASNNNYTYLTVEDKRGHAGMSSSDILPHFTGIAVHTY